MAAHTRRGERLPMPALPLPRSVQRKSHPHWFLPADWAQRFREALGGIDLDPCAARPELDQIHAVESYVYPAQDGLLLPWRGRVYCNPPYDRVGVRRFATKALREVAHLDALAVLVPCAPSSRWWRDLARSAEHVVFLPKRINFIDGSPTPGKTTSGRQCLSIFGWRLACVDAFEGIPVKHFMRDSTFREKAQQEGLWLS